MNIVKLTETIAVSGQIGVADVEAIAEQGFRILINNRPDGESADQPGSDQIAAAAELAGLRYYHIPVTANAFPGEDALLMAALLDQQEEPVLAFCRTGTRCTNLWVATRGDNGEVAAAHARSLGYDLSMSGHAVKPG